MKKRPPIGYENMGDGDCWEMFHPELKDGPYCTKVTEHEGSHAGFAVTWDREPEVTVDVAAKFIELLRRIPNGNHEIWLNDDATVGMTLRGMADAVRFIHVGRGSD